METIYRSCEGKQRVLLIVFLFLYGGLFLTFLFYRFFDADANTELIDKISSVAYLLPSLFIYAHVRSTDKIRVNEGVGIISLSDPILGLKSSSNIIYIKDITSIEVIKSKKTNKIRRFNIRCGPVKFYQVRVGRKEEFFNHIKLLVPNIQVTERFGSAI